MRVRLLTRVTIVARGLIARIVMAMLGSYQGINQRGRTIVRVRAMLHTGRHDGILTLSMDIGILIDARVAVTISVLRQDMDQRGVALV